MTGPAVLVVGAGAVGQAYALALRAGGAAVSFFIKPHHEARLADGMPIRDVGLFSVGPIEDLADRPRISDWADVAQREWHSIWLAVDSTALQGDWVADLARARGDATVVAFQTGTASKDQLSAHVPIDAIVSAMIPFIAWWSPLSPSEPTPDGPHMQVWHPPGMATPLSGPLERVHDIERLLLQGGLSVEVIANAAARGAMGSSVLLPTIAGLEVAGWDLTTLTRKNHLNGVLAAISEAQRIASHLHGVSPPPTWMMRPWLIALLARMAPRVAPFDLPTYLRVHFTKVGAQTAASLTDLEARGAALGWPTPALTALRTNLEATRPPS